MTNTFSFSTPARGWFRVPNEPCLWGYAQADGVISWYFKGRLNGTRANSKLAATTISDARREARVLRGDRSKAAERVVARRLTVGAYAERFVEAQSKRIAHPNPKLRRSAGSIELDKQRLLAFILPALGTRKLADVQVADIRRFVAGLYTLRKANGKPYAENTLRDVVRVLGALFREAAKDGLIPRSPVRELPSEERPSSQRSKAQRYLDPDQVDALIVEAGQTFGPILLLCAWAGLRISEAIGIVWADLDLEAGTLTIDAQLSRGGVRVDPKTPQSRATVDLLPAVVTELKAHRRAQAEQGVQLLAPDAYVFTTATGAPQHRRNVLRALHRAGDALGLNAEGQPKVNNHSLRHSFITNAIALGLTIPEAALLARHDVATCASTYAKVAETARRGVASKLAAALATS